MASLVRLCNPFSMPPQETPFLSATWSNLVLATYAVDPDLLAHRLAEGLELDTIDGEAFVSLVAFDFLNTKVKGIGFPGYRDFPEVNLRFYVRETSTGERGVMFVRELVPHRAIAWTAKALYNEPYEVAKMSSSVTHDEDTVTVRHDWTYRGHKHGLTVVSNAALEMPDASSPEHFFKEHQWGYGISRSGKPLVYNVQHPHWRVHQVQSHTIEVDFAQLYGAEFGPLTNATPMSLVHAEGSPIAVYPPSITAGVGSG